MRIARSHAWRIWRAHCGPKYVCTRHCNCVSWALSMCILCLCRMCAHTPRRSHASSISRFDQLKSGLTSAIYRCFRPSSRPNPLLLVSLRLFLVFAARSEWWMVKQPPVWHANRLILGSLRPRYRTRGFVHRTIIRGLFCTRYIRRLSLILSLKTNK